MTLNGKKILLFCPKYFGYENEIKTELENQGAKVELFDERPQNSPLLKAILRLKKEFINKLIEKYYNKVINEVKDIRFDYVFFVNAEAVSEKILNTLKNEFSEAIFILYMWDSVRNKKNTINIIQYFDKVFTFDKNDSLNNSKMSFRPLFYINKYKNLSRSKRLKYDFCFIGTAHSDRINLIRKIEYSMANKGKKIYKYFFLQSKLQFLYKKLFEKDFRKVKFRDVSFKSLSQDDILNVVEESRIIIDIQHPNQSGLTMRTLEVLGAKKKLITTNKDIMNYDFFNENNILLIERENPIIPDTFIGAKYKEYTNEIYNKYSIKGWVEEIIIK